MSRSTLGQQIYTFACNRPHVDGLLHSLSATPEQIGYITIPVPGGSLTNALWSWGTKKEHLVLGLDTHRINLC